MIFQEYFKIFQVSGEKKNNNENNEMFILYIYIYYFMFKKESYTTSLSKGQADSCSQLAMTGSTAHSQMGEFHTFTCMVL